MKQTIWYGGADVRLCDVPISPLGPRDVRVRVVACGVCGTDVHTIEGAFPLYAPPKPLGHETAGVVMEVGSAVHAVRPGDPVALDTSVPCGACFYCREGQPFFCPQRTSYVGGFAEQIVVPDEIVYPLPPSVPIELGVFAEPLSCALHALQNSSLRPGETAAIIGGGTIGQLLVQLARQMGAALVVLSDPEPQRRNMAVSCGADVAVDPLTDDLGERVRSLTNGRGVEVAFEAVGRAETVAAAVSLPRRRGTVMLVGVAAPTAEVVLRPYDIYERELTIRGSFIRSFTYARALALLPRLTLQPLVTHRFGLDAVPAAIRNVQQRRGVKTLVVP